MYADSGVTGVLWWMGWSRGYGFKFTWSGQRQLVHPRNQNLREGRPTYPGDRDNRPPQSATDCRTKGRIGKPPWTVVSLTPSAGRIALLFQVAASPASEARACPCIWFPAG
jgi:hypothetical protein